MNEQLRRAPSPDLLPRFAAIVGDKYAITDPVVLEPFLVEGRGLYHGRSSMLLRPGSVGEVQAILKLANETKTPLVPQGGNTGLVGGQIPFDGELILSLTRLDRIREVDRRFEHDDLRGRRRVGESAGRGGRGRSVVSAVAGR